MIGRADIEGSKSNVAMNAWLPQASYPCDVPPPPNSPPDIVLRLDRPAEASLGSKRRGCYPASDSRIGLESSSTGSSFPADSAKPVPLAVVLLDSRQGHRIPLDRTSSELAVRRPGKAPERAIPSTSPGRHEAFHSRHVTSSSSAPTVDGFGTGTPGPSPQSQSFSRSYGSILPTSLAYIVPSTKGCSPWRHDAVMSTTGRERHSVLRIFKGRRECAGHHAMCGALAAGGPYLRLSRFQGSTNPCASAAHMEPFPLRLQSSHLNIFYYHQDLHRRRSGRLASRFCRDRSSTHRGLALAPTAGIADFDFHDHRPAVLINQHRLWVLELRFELQLSRGKLRGNQLLDGSISLRPIPKSTNDLHISIAVGLHQSFLWLRSPSIVHHLSGPDRHAHSRTLLRRSRHLGPCFKTVNGEPTADASSTQMPRHAAEALLQTTIKAAASPAGVAKAQA
ncbi:hypothetical protein Bca52824_073119 [Brassica carinata]|uniref:Uncharacterized protein n=1 Tax=Brassica carinata TaxID=52824 RepID=A0A8X7U4J4_BRACI|nr:hypothetical protein Bca52824_073119 [Brassica carinata]